MQLSRPFHAKAYTGPSSKSMLAGTSAAPPPTWLIALFPGFFVGMWCFVSVLLARMGGWHRLGEKFRAFGPASGTRHRMQSIRLGLVNYNSCLTIHVSDEGLHLATMLPFRLAHPPLFIPWAELQKPVAKKSLWMTWIEVEIGNPRVVKVSLPAKVFDGREGMLGKDSAE